MNKIEEKKPNTNITHKTPPFVVRFLFYVFIFKLFQIFGYELYYKYKGWFKSTYKKSKWFRFLYGFDYLDKWNVFVIYASAQYDVSTPPQPKLDGSMNFKGSWVLEGDLDEYFDKNDSTVKQTFIVKSNNKVWFDLLNPDTPKPQYAHTGDACMDVVAVSKEETEQYIEYGLGFRTIFGSNLVGEIRPRSSISKYDLVLANSPATIDSNYRGEWKVRFKKLKKNGVFYEIGDRVAQIKFDELTTTQNIFDSNFFNELLESEQSQNQRGTGGFGSSGK